MSPMQRWQAVLARDRRFDGAFVYAVRSTGIYCRPSCASRRPRRGQVTFFPIPEAAEREGFRACRRCHPADVNGGDPAVTLVREACRAIAAGEGPRGDARRLARAFKRILGITPRAYAEARRVTRFKQELKRRKHVSPALYEAGYSSTSRVYEHAHEQLGMTPATYARSSRRPSAVSAALRSATTTRRSQPSCSPSFPRRELSRIRAASSRGGSRQFSRISTAANRISTCRSTFERPHSSGG